MNLTALSHVPPGAVCGESPDCTKKRRPMGDSVYYVFWTGFSVTSLGL